MAVKSRLRTQYPAAFKKCIPEALIYGKCVATSIDLKVKECDKEFKQLNKCFQEAIKAMK